MPVPEVVLYSKPECCLCEEVKAQLHALKNRHAFALREVNILDDEETHEQFKEEIPVIFINGKKAFKYHLDKNKFLKRLGAGAKHGA
jgi:glutaredoxin